MARAQTKYNLPAQVDSADRTVEWTMQMMKNILMKRVTPLLSIDATYIGRRLGILGKGKVGQALNFSVQLG